MTIVERKPTGAESREKAPSSWCGVDLGARTVSYDESDAILCALAVGAKATVLDLVMENRLRILPTFALALAQWAPDELGNRGGIDKSTSLHGGQNLKMLESRPRSGSITLTAASVRCRTRAPLRYSKSRLNASTSSPPGRCSPLAQVDSAASGALQATGPGGGGERDSSARHGAQCGCAVLTHRQSLHHSPRSGGHHRHRGAASDHAGPMHPRGLDVADREGTQRTCGRPYRAAGSLRRTHISCGPARYSWVGGWVTVASNTRCTFRPGCVINDGHVAFARP